MKPLDRSVCEKTLLELFSHDILQPNSCQQIGLVAEPQTNHNLGRQRLVRSCIRYHLVQIIDEIRNLGVCEPLVPALLVVRDPTLKLHSWHKQVVLNQTSTPCGGLANVPFGPLPTTVLTSLATVPPLCPTRIV